MNAISRLIQPRSVAIIGASADLQKTAGRPLSYLQKHGFEGAIYPVNPRVSHIGDVPCYPDIDAIPGVPDVAIVLLGAGRAQQAVAELASKGTGAAIVLASGYSEAGEDGQRLQQQLREAAGPMRILGPNTIGLVNLTDNIPLSASGALEMDHFPAGSLGVVSQSGGILGALLSRAAARGVGMSKLISTSNEVDLELADFIDYLVDDDATRVIALYIEAIRHPQKFRAAALRARLAGKPIVAFKIGRSEAGAQAAVSHTGALAGQDTMYDALFRQTGVIRAQRFTDLLDMPSALATGRTLHGRRIAILTSTGGAGTLVSDSLGVADFETPAPGVETSSTLRALQTGMPAALDRNPVDVTLAGLQPDLLRGAIRALADSSDYDALIMVVGSSSLAQPELMANAIDDCLPHTNKPILAFVSPHAPNVACLLNQRGIPAFMEPESCAVALDALWQTKDGLPSESTNAERIDVALADLPHGSLNEAQAKALFARFGIPGVRETIVSTPTQAQEAAQALGSRVVLKIVSADILHKSDVGGVAVGIAPQQVSDRIVQMQKEVSLKAGVCPDQFLVQEMVTDGVELILGFHRDALGSAILLGMGGVTAELLKDTSMRLLPTHGGLNLDDAYSLMRDLRTWPLLDGYRGRIKADQKALAQAIVAFSNMVADLGDKLTVAEINPLFVLPEGQGVKAADGIAILSE
ncbi:6-carboxyhexanoate--CoA ligase [Advenella kashmirensis W13003]|uniref:6-carboxyhexanoate--CoA ligase n=1 Tax=Advenella kashmirensis W13003 TaxID=1424334 RepID=V8QNT3_9BURK|nr:acetate--CoA ligase family protein [Advenella kashmirensis]ETF00639.1 6-carboxyhexanoate--CoA ligase [Advenella kashmirensis W13003]